MKSVVEKIKEFEKKGISNIKLLAIVTKTRSEVVFYGNVDGSRYQSNDLVETGIIEFDVVDSFYEDIAKTIRKTKKFDETKTNIIMADSSECTIKYDDATCKTYKIVKEWEKSL